MNNPHFSELTDFPYLIVDRDSYIVSARILTNLNFCKDFYGYNFQIGKHTSIAENVKFVINLNKDYHKVAMGIVSGAAEAEDINPGIKFKGEIFIENDCWIGSAARIMSGVTIGSGAIVAAYSVVTKDVPPYAIVGGNPAKILGYRFSESEIRALLKISWWDWPEEQKVKNIDLLRGEPQKLIEKYLPEAETTLKGIRKDTAITKEEGQIIYSFKVDLDSKFPLTDHIISEYVHNKENTNSKLVLYLSNKLKVEERQVLYDLTISELSQYSDYNVTVQIVDDDHSIEDIVRESDYFITTRDEEMIHVSSFARLCDTKVMSGVDVPLF